MNKSNENTEHLLINPNRPSLRLSKNRSNQRLLNVSKSILRISGCVCGIFGLLIPAFVLIGIAEMVTIKEELF